VRGLAEIIPLRTAQCRDSVDAVAQMAAGEDDVDPRAAAHVRTCLRCQAEVAAYRRILRTMRAMRHDLVEPPRGSVADLLRALGGVPPEGSADAGSSWAVMAACVGGLTAAGAAGVIVWFTRRRPGALAPAI
jgi:hypothetical protein